MNNIINLSNYLQKKKQGGVSMCQALKNIQGKTAEDILKEFGNPNTIPIDLNEILYNAGISALPYDFTQIEKRAGIPVGDILGLVKSQGENAIIYYKQDDTLNRQRFTIAHELAHCVLHLTGSGNEQHIEFRIKDLEDENHEKEAAIFAGKLLIPIKQLYEVYINLPVPKSSILAAKFGVSISVMEARLDYLKVSYYNKNGQAIVYGND